MPTVKTDERLIKRAKYGARNLTGLAILATVLAGIILLGAAIGNENLLWVGLSISAMAAGYWVLAAVARHGEQRALAIAVGIMVANFIFSLGGLMIGYLRTNNASPAGFIGLLVPLLVILALTRNYSDILELKHRGLWQSVFAAEQPKTSYCAIGGLLLSGGIIALIASCLIPALDEASFIRSREEFVSLIQVDDKQFLDAVGNASHTQPPPSVDELMAKVDAIQKKAKSIGDAASETSGLQPIIQTYLKSLEKCRYGLLAIREQGPGPASQVHFAEADALRQEAFKAFDAQTPPHR